MGQATEEPEPWSISVPDAGAEKEVEQEEPRAPAARPRPRPRSQPRPAAPKAPPRARSIGAEGMYERFWDTGVPNVLTLARRELASLFVSPIAYVVGAAIILPTSLLGYLQQINSGSAVSMAGVFNYVTLSMVLFTPLFTMRLLAEEQRSGTLDSVLSSPVRVWELVAGKWLAGLTFFLATTAFTLVYVVLISVYQRDHGPASFLGQTITIPNVDYGAVFTGYVGVLLVGAAWVALGLLMSSLTQNQIIAAVAGITTLLVLEYGFGVVSGFLGPPLGDLFDYLSAANRAQSFFNGQLVLRDAVYFVTVTIGALAVAARVIESRRWR